MDQAYYNDAIRLAMKSVVTAGMAATALLMLGAPMWKAAVAFLVVMVAHRANMGRRFFEGAACVGIIIALTIWVEVLPPREAMLEKIATIRQLM